MFSIRPFASRPSARRAPMGAALATLFLAVGGASPASAQVPGAEPGDTTVYDVDPITVTATRGPRTVTETPRPVSVLQERDLIEEMPNTVSDLFRDVAGLDVSGVGVSQVRPQIRGQAGQRILLLNDGLRMNNTRRQRDFGELPALVDVGAVQQVEVVRGPASVLYGSDAIGGVVNIVTKVPSHQQGFRGTASYLFGSAGEQSKASARVQGREGNFSVIAGGSWRTVGSYEAPSGGFGDISLSDEVRVQHSGVEDVSVDARLGWDFGGSSEVFGKVEHYRSDDAGFGFVDPAAYAPGSETIEITYPEQRFYKFTGGLRTNDLGLLVADRVDLTLYGQNNDRELAFDAVFPAGPGAQVALDNNNNTDIRTYGFRVEAAKLATLGMEDVIFTYGFDGFREDAVSSDFDVSTVTGFGPPIVDTSAVPSLPEARYLSLGAFAQAEVQVADLVTVIASGRYQDVNTETFTTEGLSNTPIDAGHNALVWAVNAMFEVVPNLNLIASTGRAFRSPNLVELFFDGTVPEAGAYQAAAPDLEAEKSFNFDLGFRYSDEQYFLEGFYFHNKITDGIRSRPVLESNGDTVQTAGFDTYQNVNLDELVVQGVEINAGGRFPGGFDLGTSLSWLRAEDAIDPDNPIGESYSSKVVATVGYHDPDGRFWGSWQTRVSGENKDIAIGSGNPLGSVLPSFAVHGIRGGVRLIETGGVTHGLTLEVSNLTNELYAETANASFFRPEPKRSVTLSWDVAF